MIPALSFRTKLLLAMILVVVGVTGATLYIAQNKFQETLREALADKFRLQMQGFLDRQELLLGSVKQACTNLVAGRRLQDALAAVTDGGVTDRLYQQVKVELETRNLLAAQTSNTNAFLATFFLFLDAAGKVIAPPASYEEINRLIRQPHLEQQLEVLGRGMSSMSDPITGYITPTTESGQLILQQAIVTKVIDSIAEETLGALIMAFPLPDLGEKVGILFEGRIYSRSIPEAMKGVLVQRVGEQLGIPTKPSESLMETVGGEPHQVFHQPLNQDPHFPKAQLVALISVKEALEQQRDLRARIFFFGGVGLVGALILSLLLSHGFSAPIEELVRGTTEIQRGNFGVKVAVRSRDEIGRLTQSFNEMAEGLALKEKYRSVLDKVADKAVAEELVKGVVKLGGEERQISVLFCDIRGFTALSQGMDPGEVIRMLNEHFTPLTRVVYEHEGFVDKFVGDLIMAVFGAPKSSTNDACNAARCALGMIRERERLNETSKYKIKIGIGVASGPALAGNMGSSDRLNYTVIGERVNLASRLCGKAGRMEVVIDETTYQRLQPLLEAEPLPELELKGFSARVQAYRLLNIHPTQTSV
ncbi:MAG: HAMP domain-containing protein [Verrucomicrobia bacterium]|nr:HAMP domain-containing protein [Verrucomicrobiota bacterium]